MRGHIDATNLTNQEPTHRYFCDACTKIAFYHNIANPLPKSAVCAECKKHFTELKKENLILLD